MEDPELLGNAVSNSPQEGPQDGLQQGIREIANHFNNLLLGIMGNAQLIEDEGLSSRQAPNYLREIKACASRASTLMEQLSLLVEDAPAARPRTGPRMERGTSVLVIDDEEAVRSVSSGILARAGFEVISAADGVAGIDLFERSRHQVRCVFLDLSMPYMRGNLVFARLRAIDANVPIFVMSGHTETYVEREFSSLGIAGLIRKPFQPDDLINAIQSVSPIRRREVVLDAA